MKQLNRIKLFLLIGLLTMANFSGTTVYAQKIIENEESIADFGCSDCKCHSHLIYFKNSKLANLKVSSILNSFD